MADDAFFTRDGERYIPGPACRGPWNPNSLHGRVIAGLIGFELERLHGGTEWMPVRLTVDMYRLPDFSPITAATRVVRGGKRLRIVDCELVSGGASVARGTCQFLVRSENAPGVTWSPPDWNAAKPDELPPPPQGQFGERMWKMRNITGPFDGSVKQRRAWLSEIRELVEGFPLTPFQRVAVAADFASPLANRSDAGLGYINTDVTVYLHRLPMGEWIGFETANHHATDGIAIGECFLYDLEGAIGTVSTAALRQSRG